MPSALRLLVALASQQKLDSAAFRKPSAQRQQLSQTWRRASRHPWIAAPPA